MKKIITLLMLAGLSLSSFSQAATSLRPTFEEFCPSVYYQKEPIPENLILPARFSTGEKAAMWSSVILLYPAIFTYPLAISDTEWRRKQRSEKIRDEYNSALLYWKKRELAFEKSLNLCESVEDKASCYLQVKMSEQQKDLQIQQDKVLRGTDTSINALITQQTMTNINSNNTNSSLKH